MPAGYRAEYGILLDMVGRQKRPLHPRGHLAPERARPRWTKSGTRPPQIGYSDYFLYQDTDPITDDHVFTAKAGVPTVDIYDHPALRR